MNHGEEEIIAFTQVLLYSADDHRSVHVADFLGDDADGIGSLYAQGSRQEIGPVLELLRCRKNALSWCVLEPKQRHANYLEPLKRFRE